MPMDKCTFNPGNECLGMQKANMLEKSLNSHLDAARHARRWEGLADKAIWAVFAAVIAFLLAKIGL